MLEVTHEVLRTPSMLLLLFIIRLRVHDKKVKEREREKEFYGKISLMCVGKEKNVKLNI